MRPVESAEWPHDARIFVLAPQTRRERVLTEGCCVFFVSREVQMDGYRRLMRILPPLDAGKL